MISRKTDRRILRDDRLSKICKRAGIYEKSEWNRKLNDYGRASWVRTGGPPDFYNADRGGFRFTWDVNPILLGVNMEEIDNLLRAVNAEVSESKKILETMTNDIKALSENIQPELAKMIKQIRDNRMAVVLELRQSLDLLNDVQDFFMDSKYESEMEKMERFVRICREIMELKKEGVFDDICDSAIRLALREARKNEGQ